MKSINPATEELIAEYAETSEGDVENRLKMADDAQRSWRTSSFPQRAERMKAMAQLLLDEQDSAARMMTQEMGKPIRQARAEIEKCAWVCEYYAENAERMLSERRVKTDAAKSYVRHDPLGAVLCVMPWNFPYWQVFRFAAPATMAGNATILKHASNVCGVALTIEELFVEAGFPAGLFATLLLPPERAQKLVEHPVVRGVTLTGSERAGRALAGAAGKSLKKTVLELGGSDPFIVLADADLPAAARAAAKARTQNTGQSCIAAKRFIVEEPALQEFTEAFVAEMKALNVGDPMDEEADLGPLARSDLRDTLHDQVQRSVQAGAALLAGGNLPDGAGWFYPPTVLASVRPGMPAFDEETFGPVAAIVPANDEREALELANQSRYGLGASLWTGDAARGEELAREIQAGCVFVNQIVKSDPRLPFGGVKDSGYGRELAEDGIIEFVNRKTVWVE